MVSLMSMPAIPASTGTKKDISPGELSQRIAVIKRFKELLKAQRDRFRAYLDALDRQKDVIQGGTADDLLRHVELEEKIVADIFSIQKVIDPLEKMYYDIKTQIPVANKKDSLSLNSARLKPAEKQDGEEITGLKEALEGLKAEAVIRSEQNRELLSKRMAELRSEIKSLKNSPYNKRRFDSGSQPTQIDISG